MLFVEKSWICKFRTESTFLFVHNPVTTITEIIDKDETVTEPAVVVFSDIQERAYSNDTRMQCMRNRDETSLSKKDISEWRYQIGCLLLVRFPA